MRQVAEQLAAERVIAHVLDDRAGIGMRVGLEESVGRGGRKAAKKEGFEVGLPSGIDDGFMA